MSILDQCYAFPRLAPGPGPVESGITQSAKGLFVSALSFVLARYIFLFDGCLRTDSAGALGNLFRLRTPLRISSTQ